MSKKLTSILLALIMVLSIMTVGVVSVAAGPIKPNPDDEGGVRPYGTGLFIRFVDSVTGTQLSPNSVIQDSFTIKSMFNGTVDKSFYFTISDNTVHVSDDILYFDGQFEVKNNSIFEFDGYESSGRYYDGNYYDGLYESSAHYSNAIASSTRICILTVTVSRECGDNVTYDLDDGTLTISGTGDMYDYTASEHSPFYDNDNIEEVVVENGVTSIGDYSFDECDNIESITVADSVNRIGTNAFEDFTKPTDVITTNPVVKSFFSTKGFAPSLRTGGLVNYNESEITKSGNDGTSIVTLDYSTANLKVTVPTVLPVNVDSNNSVTVADNAQISNLSNGSVDVTNAEIQTDEWSVVGFDTDFTKVPVDTKQYGFKLNGDDVSDGVNTSVFNTINGNNHIGLSYDANVAIQSQPITNEDIGRIVFTVAWHK